MKRGRNRAKIVVIGSYNVGLVVRTHRLPAWGETFQGSGFSEGPGGKGSNQAVAAARLGADVHFVGCVGNDYYGESALRMLTSEKVDASYVISTNKAKTGVGFILLNDEGDNCIIVDLGANLLLAPEDVEKVEHLLEQADILLVQLENNLETIAAAMKSAQQKGKMVILNPAPAQQQIDFLLAYASIVTPNESELKILNGVALEKQLSEEECLQYCRNLLEKGPQAVVVTRGEQGAIMVTKEHHLTIPAPKVVPVDTTGAGDCFSGALAVAIGEGNSLEEAVRFACYAGAYTVMAFEVIPALPTREMLNVFLTAEIQK